ncbi:MAG: alpha/beta hydrolase [Thermomonas sp.]
MPLPGKPSFTLHPSARQIRNQGLETRVEMTLRQTGWIKVLATSVLALWLSGCEATVFRFVNRGLPPPDLTVPFAPDIGLSMDVYRPHTVTGAKAPVVVFFYGGSWQRGERAQYQFVGQRLADNGVLAVIADYRTYPAVMFPGFMDDAARAVRRAHDDVAGWGGDPDRLFIAGHSAGAQIAALLATDPRYLHAHGMEPDQLAGVIGLSGPYDFDVTGDLVDVFGSPSLWPRAQAVNFVDGNEPPFLLLHGTGDRVVEYADSVELAEKLRTNGIPATLKLLPDAGHIKLLAGLYDPNRAPEVLSDMLAFIKGDRTASSAQAIH